MQQRKHSRTAPLVRLVDYSLFKYYKEHYRATKPTVVKDYKLFMKIVRRLFELTSEKLIEKEGGVYLDKIGYLCHWRTPEPKFSRGMVNQSDGTSTPKTFLNMHDDGKWYTTTLFTEAVAGNPLNGWSLDKTTASPLKKSLWQALNNGKKYKCFLYTLKSLFSKQNKNKYDI